MYVPFCFVFVIVVVSVRPAHSNVSCFGRADRHLVEQRLGTKTPYRFLSPASDGGDGKDWVEPYEGINNGGNIFCLYAFLICIIKIKLKILFHFSRLPGSTYLVPSPTWDQKSESEDHRSVWHSTQRHSTSHCGCSNHTCGKTDNLRR